MILLEVSSLENNLINSFYDPFLKWNYVTGKILFRLDLEKSNKRCKRESTY